MICQKYGDRLFIISIKNDRHDETRYEIRRSVMLDIGAVILAAVCWGMCGVIAQHLFMVTPMTANDLTVARLLLSGFLFLFPAMLSGEMRSVAGTKKDWFWRIPVFGIVGILSVQFTYFASIFHGNAAAATVLQYLAPVLIVLYLAARRRRCPDIIEGIGTLLAVIGVLLMVSGGSTERLTVPWLGIVWGLISAVSLAFYTLYPIDLLKNIPAYQLLGVGMLWGGLFGCATIGLRHPHLFLRPDVLWPFLAIVVLGTVIPFYLYLYALRSLSPTEVSVFACTEPFAAIIFSSLVLHMTFGVGEMLGAVSVVGAIILLALRR